ncbi:transposase [Blautia sp.]|uniref:transposase n=1 Tax=Blautia sp. TaxID=1955243 RepID=UPI003AB6A038
MNEARIYADEFQTTFANTKEMLDFLASRGQNSQWIRKPTRLLRLLPLEKEADKLKGSSGNPMDDILEDTEKNTNLLLKVNGETYPVRNCAIQTILSRARVSGYGLRDLETATYAKVVNYCLKVAKGDALIKIADGKVSAVHGGDEHDYSILDMREIFATTSEYLQVHFKGSEYMEGSGMYDHSIVSATWKLGGNQELLDTYRKALRDNGLEDKVEAPALRLTSSDVAASGANLYPMLICESSSRTISLGSPIKLAHEKRATLTDFRNNLSLICSRYQDAITNLSILMDIEIRHPSNCLRLVMRKIGIRKKLINQVVELYEAQNGTGPCTAHDLYYAMNEASFFGACEGLQGYSIIKLEEEITRALSLDWKEFDVGGAIKW